MKTIALIQRPKWSIKFKFKLQDFWVGVFWESKYNIGYEASNGISEKVSFDLYICLLPCLPLHFKWWK